MAHNLTNELARLHIKNQSPKQFSVNDNSLRKVAPIVPPKPKKSEPQLPIVPKSTSTKHKLEPSFSTLLEAPTVSGCYRNQTPPPQYNCGYQYSNLPKTDAPYRAPDYSHSSNYSNASNYSNLSGVSQLNNYASSSWYSNYSDLDNINSSASISSYGSYANDVDLPPPPPPEPGNYIICESDTFPLPPPPDEIHPPPSPVSSSYSELRRATANAQQLPYQVYAPPSQSSLTESIYEPINPRPSSQLSSNSQYSLNGGSLYNLYGGHKMKTVSAHPNSRATNEAEVDALTNLLVQGMDSSGDVDFFGICHRCGKKVVGEGSGCTAMDQVYHIQCFTCSVCHINLQGKPFYAVEGKPYCEQDYFDTLEKCCVCTKPILDRILRATGKPYHPLCFTCVVCGKSLDGIPFTVDALNQIYCIEDFHKKFAPRCSVCKQPIMPELGKEETVRVVALDRSFHVNCYKCEDCGLVLSSEAEGKGCYPLDDHVLCKGCNTARIQALTSKMVSEQ